MKYAELKAAATRHGCTVGRVDGEYRVNLVGATEATAYYTDCPVDALHSMEAMRREANLKERAGY